MFNRDALVRDIQAAARQVMSVPTCPIRRARHAELVELYIATQDRPQDLLWTFRP